MAHNIFGQRFYQNRTAPAWHGIGLNSEVPMLASEAFAELGEYRVGLVPLKADGLEYTTGFSMVVRYPTSDDPLHRYFGTPVSDDYVLITPQDACALWDENVLDENNQPVPVETFGILQKGARLFITVKLPDIDVEGDAINTYMVYDNPMYAGRSAGVYTTGVRVVCQNTLSAAIGDATQRKLIAHTPGAKDMLAGWMREIYSNALLTVGLLREAYTALATVPATLPQVRWIAEQTYAMPKRPDEARGSLPYAERLDTWMYWCDMTKRLREEVVSLYEGKGVGMDTRAVSGTLFGAYNAVAELETYRKSTRLEVSASDLINGERSDRIKHAFELALGLAQNKVTA